MVLWCWKIPEFRLSCFEREAQWDCAAKTRQ